MGNQNSNSAPYSQSSQQQHRYAASIGQSPSNMGYLQHSGSQSNAAYDASLIDTSNKVQNLTFGASQSGVKNTSESVKFDNYSSPQKIISQQEFEYWRQKGNELAVEALQNSDKLSWPEFKGKLLAALSFYSRTPCLSMIYTNVCLGNQHANDNNQKYSFEQRMSLLAKLNNQQVLDKQFNYLEEILRVSKNKSVCYRALIQNMYIQMQNNIDGHLNLEQLKNEQVQPQSTDELMRELLDYFLSFTENLNLNLLYIIDQLGQDPVTKEIGTNFKSNGLIQEQSPLSNDAGPGGSPQTFQGLNSFQNTDSMSQSINQMPEMLKLKMLNSQRFCEILQSCQFIFQDKFIKNVLSNEINLSKKIKFLEKIYESINENNYDFLRKTSFYLAKTYYKKSCLSQNEKNIQASLHENQYAFLYLQRYRQYTQKIEENFILGEAAFLANDQKTNLHPQEVQKFQQRIENQQSMIRFLLSQTKSKGDQVQSSAKKTSPKLAKSATNGAMLMQNWKIRKYAPNQIGNQVNYQLNNSMDANVRNPQAVKQRTSTPKVFSQKSISPHPISKRPLKKVITRRLSYYQRQQYMDQQQEIVEIGNNLNCFNACYSANFQQNQGIMTRDRSPFSSLSCADPSRFAFSDGDAPRPDKSELNADQFGIMSDRQLKIQVKSNSKKGKKYNVNNNQSRGPFKVSAKNQNAMKLLEPKSACDGSIISTILGDDELAELRPKSIDDIKASYSNQSNIPMPTADTPSQIQQSESRPSNKALKEKNITKIIVKKQEALNYQNRERHNNDMIVNLEVQNNKCLPVYLRKDKRNKMSTQSNYSNKGQKVVPINEYQKMQRQVNKLRLEKKLRQGNHASYQQKMITDRMRSKMIFKDQEAALKNMHERQQRRLFPMKQSYNAPLQRNKLSALSRQSMISNKICRKLSTNDLPTKIQQRLNRESNMMQSAGDTDDSRLKKRQMNETNKSTSVNKKRQAKQLKSPGTPASLKPDGQQPSSSQQQEIRVQTSRPKVSRKKQMELKQREPWRVAIGKLDRDAKTVRGKSSLSRNSGRTSRMLSQSPRTVQRSARKKRSSLRNKGKDNNRPSDNQFKSEFKVYAKNIYQTQKQVTKRKIELHEQAEKQPIDIKIDVDQQPYHSNMSAKSQNDQEQQERVNTEGQSSNNREPENSERDRLKNEALFVPLQKKDKRPRKKRLNDFQKNFASTKAANSNNQSQSDRESRMIRNISNNIDRLNKRLNQAVQSPTAPTARSKKEQLKKKQRNLLDTNGLQASREQDQSVADRKSDMSTSKGRKKLGDQSYESKHLARINQSKKGKKLQKPTNDERLNKSKSHNQSTQKLNDTQAVTGQTKDEKDKQQKSAENNKPPHAQIGKKAIQEEKKKGADNKQQAKNANMQSSKKPNKTVKKPSAQPANQQQKQPKSNQNVNEHDFEPLRKLGRGSFGDVYLVRHVTDPIKPGAIYAMKTLSKKNNLEDSWIRYVKTERDVLAYSDNPFIVKLKYAFQTRKKLFLIIDFCPGGDLETLLSNENGPLDLEKAKFYIAEILLALRDLHARNIIYRDLKPDNVVIDNDGHAQLIDFGMAKQHITEVQKGAKTFCGSVKYLAPEMLKKMGHGQALDWYLLGVLLYEMVVGVTPYFSSDKDVLFNNILYGKLKLPKGIDYDVKSLLISLLNRNPNKRLGSVPGDKGALEIMSHPFFDGIDWEALIKKRNNGQFAFWPKPPKYTIDDYQEAFPQTQLTNEQIYQIYYGDDNEDEEAEDRSLDQSDDDFQEDTKQKKKKTASQYYVYIDGWDFNRDLNQTDNEQMETQNRNLLAAISLLKQQQQQEKSDMDEIQEDNNQNQVAEGSKSENGAAQQNNSQLQPNPIQQTSISANGDMAPPIEYKPSVQDLKNERIDQVDQQSDQDD